MLKNYIKITWRHLTKKKGHSIIIISIAVLAIAFALIFAISLQEKKPQVIAPVGGPSTGAKLSFDYIGTVRTYPNKKLPKEGFAQAFEQKKEMLSSQKAKQLRIWESIGPINIGGRTLALAINPSNPKIVFAGSASGGLWKSTTGGSGLDAWDYVSTGFPVLGVAAIAIDPQNPDVMYIGTGESYGTAVNMPGVGPVRTTRGSYGIGILKSTDGGETWQLIHDVAMTTDIVFNLSDTSIVYTANGGMGSLGHGVYRTEDAGNTFEKMDFISGGGPSHFQGKAVLAISKSNPDIIMASIGNSDGTTGIDPGIEGNRTWLMRSDNGGDTWALVFSNSDFYASFQGWYSHAIAIHPSNSQIVWAAGEPYSLYKSDNGGGNLSSIEPQPAAPYGGNDPPELYPFLNSWADHHDIIFHPTNPNIIYFINDGGIFRTTDGGVTVENCNSGYQTVQFYNGVSNSDTNGSLMMGGLQDNNSVIYEGSLNWRRGWGGDGSWTALNQIDNNIVYFSAQYGQAVYSDNLFTEHRFGDRYAYPGLDVFPKEETNFITPLVLSPVDNKTLYIGGEKILKSTDEGISWTITNGGNALDGNAMSVLAASHQNLNVVYAASSPKATTPNVYRTNNGGDSWLNITGTLPDRFPTDLAIDPNDDEKVYITFGGFGTSHVFKTENGGSTWTDIGAGLPDIPTWAVTVDPEFPNHIYVGNEIGVFQSLDGGETWEDISANLPDAIFAMELVISKSNRKLRVASHGNGVYQIDLPAADFNEEPDLPLGFELKQNYPNPFNPTTTIRYDLKKIGKVKLEVFDISGKLVTTLVDYAQGIGIYEVHFDGSRLSSGTYIYRLQVGNKISSKRMVLLK